MGRGIEGYTDLAKIIAKIGYNEGLTLAVARVIQVEPEIKLKDRDTSLIYEEDELAINEDLLPMTETVKIDGVSHTIEYPMQLKVGDLVLYCYNADGLGFTHINVIMKIKYL
ncbi:DUF2577 family protein [Cytobacillus firmus]|uniref:DUF2577 family protein n=1 Tax=Cytobacillus firmus TaxID=1399 RepID=UPI0036C0CEA2